MRNLTQAMDFTGNMQRFLQIVLLCLLALTSVHATALERVTYYHNDALGSPVAATDQDGNLLWREQYEPYGERLLQEDGDTNTLWFTGKPEESAFGINYFGARWYDPTIGRFLAIDPVGFNEDNLQSFNRYAYANNNPYLYVDPDGQIGLVVHAFQRELSMNEAMQVSGTGTLTLIGAGAGVIKAGDTISDVGNPLKVLAKKGIINIIKNLLKGEKPRIKVLDITKPGKKTPNYGIDKTKQEFEKILKDNGFSQQTIKGKKGSIEVFSKNGNKEYTTREFSNTGGPTGEIFINNRRRAKIRFKKEN